VAPGGVTLIGAAALALSLREGDAMGTRLRR
jgi:hypothetical protein